MGNMIVAVLVLVIVALGAIRDFKKIRKGKQHTCEHARPLTEDFICTRIVGDATHFYCDGRTKGSTCILNNKRG